MKHCPICGNFLDGDDWCADCLKYPFDEDDKEVEVTAEVHSIKKPVLLSKANGNYDASGNTCYLFDLSFDKISDYHLPTSVGDLRVKMFADFVSDYLTFDEPPYSLSAYFLAPFVKAIIIKRKLELEKLITHNFIIENSNRNLKLLWKYLPIFYEEIAEFVKDNGREFVMESHLDDGSCESATVNVTAALVMFNTEPNMKKYFKNLTFHFLLPVIENHFWVFYKMEKSFRQGSLSFVENASYDIWSKIIELMNIDDLLAFDVDGEELWSKDDDFTI